MSKTILLTIPSIFILLAGCSNKQSCQHWKIPFKKGQDAFDKEQYKLAKEHWNSTKNFLKEKSECQIEYSYVLEKLGSLNYKLKNLDAAEKYFKEVLNIRQKLLGPDHYLTGVALKNLGLVYRDKERFLASEALLLHSIKIFRISGQEQPDHESDALNCLGALYYDQGQLKRAESQFLKALTLDKISSRSDASFASTLNNIAMVYVDQGKFSKAESIYKEVLHIKELKFGKQSIEVATVKNNLASLYFDLKDYDKAEQYFHQVLHIQKEKLGDQNIGIADTLNNLGNLYLEKQHYSDSKAYLKKALLIYDSTLGKEHSVTKSTRAQLEHISKTH